MLEIQLEQTQKQILSTKQIQSLNVLAMCNIELKKYVETVALDNPVMELIHTNEYICQDDVFCESRKGGYKNIEMNKLYNIPDTKIDIRQFLLEQIEYTKLTKPLISIVEKIIGYIDDQGFLPYNNIVLSNLIKEDREYIQEGIKIIQQMEPTGVGTENYMESIILQLNRKGETNTVIDSIVRNSLNDLCKGKYNKLVKQYSVKKDDLIKLMKSIHQTHPVPFNGIGGERPIYIVPDIVVEEDNQKMIIRINDTWLGNICVNSMYENIAKKTNDNILKFYLEEHIQQVEDIKKYVKRRRATLTQIMQMIIQYQAEYFLYGYPLRPITQKYFSKKFKIQESTFNRAIHHKYIQSKQGIIEIPTLFSQQNKISGINNIYTMLENIISEENPHHPYSDSKLVSIMESRGIYISRRTIAKYRDSLGISGSIARKYYVKRD